MSNFLSAIVHNKFRAKWIGGITLIAVIPSFLLSLFLIYTLSIGRLHDIEKMGENLSVLCKGFLVEEFSYYDYRGLIQKVNYLYSSQSLAYIEILDRDKNIIYSMPSPLEKAASDHVLSHQVLIESKDGKNVGAVIFGINTLEADQSKIKFLIILAFWSVLGSFLIVIALLAAIRALLRPHNEILSHLSKTASGSYEVFNKYNDANDERKTIAEHFNKLITDISTYQQKATENSTNQAIARTTQMLAHDLKNPINAIELSFDAITIDNFSSQMVAIKAALSRLRHMTEKFKNADIEGVVKQNWTAIDWQSIVDNMNAIGADAGCKMYICQSFTGELHVDADKIQRAVMNLIRNSIEAGSKNIWLSTYANGTTFALDLKDDGPGVPASIVPKLFERGVTSGKKEGTGLGLNSVKETAQGHGGDVRYERKDGRSVFIITLPNIAREEIIEVAAVQEIALQQQEQAMPKIEDSITKAMQKEIFTKITLKLADKQLEAQVVEAISKQYPAVVVTDTLEGSSFLWSSDRQLVREAMTKRIPIQILQNNDTFENITKVIFRKLQYFT